MKKYVIYECEKCGMKSKICEEIERCEANHIGLTLEERAKYLDLEEKVKIHSHIASRTNNERTRNDLDKAIKELIEFEGKYNIK